MIQIPDKSRKIEIDFLLCSIGKFNLIEILYLQNGWKIAENIDQIVRTPVT